MQKSQSLDPCPHYECPLHFLNLLQEPLLPYLLSIMSVLVTPSGVLLSVYCLSIFCLSSLSQTLEQCKLRKTLKLWHQKYIMLKTIEQSSKHLHRAVCEEPVAMLSEDLSTSSGFDSSVPATLTSQSSLEKVRRSWYTQTALRY